MMRGRPGSENLRLIYSSLSNRRCTDLLPYYTDSNLDAVFWFCVGDVTERWELQFSFLHERDKTDKMCAERIWIKPLMEDLPGLPGVCLFNVFVCCFVPLLVEILSVLSGRRE